jgi:hypothetical protein
MGLSATEFNVIKAIAELKQASPGMVAGRTMITPGYAEYLCRCLMKEGYLEFIDHGAFCLSPKGREAMTGKTYQLPWDKGMIQAIAQELVKQLGGIPGLRPPSEKVSKKRAWTQEPEKREIKIKESFIYPLEEETTLKHIQSQKPKESRISSEDIQKTLEALKKYK